MFRWVCFFSCQVSAAEYVWVALTTSFSGVVGIAGPSFLLHFLRWETAFTVTSGLQHPRSNHVTQNWGTHKKMLGMDTVHCMHECTEIHQQRSRAVDHTNCNLFCYYVRVPRISPSPIVPPLRGTLTLFHGFDRYTREASSRMQTFYN
jgi:hypothetical protein